MPYKTIYFKELDQSKLSTKLIKMLDQAREQAGIPFIINSSYRNNDPKSHGKGKAVDIQCIRSHQRFRIIKALIDVGFSRIGIYSRHIHADIDTSKPLQVIWRGIYTKN